MTCILYLRSSQVGPFWEKKEFLERHGQEGAGRPRLPYPSHPRPWWRWIVAYLDQGWFREAVQVAQHLYDACRPDFVGSDKGEPVVMKLASRDYPDACPPSPEGKMANSMRRPIKTIREKMQPKWQIQYAECRLY